DLQVSGLLFSYDYQHLHRRPSFWVSTFVGKPRVYPVPLPLGWGFRVLNVEDRPPAFRDTLDMEFAEAHLAWNPWQSRELYNHFRIEAGADFGKYWQNREAITRGAGTGRWYVGFSSAMKSRFALGNKGLHYLFADIAYLRPTFVGGEAIPAN